MSPRMKVEIYPLQRSTLAEFGEQHALTLEARQHSETRWTVQFKRCETLSGAVLGAVYGDGPTAKQAAMDYARKISGELLVFSARGLDRREMWVPVLDAEDTTGLGIGFHE